MPEQLTSGKAPSLHDIHALVRRVDNGDTAALPELRKAVEAHPDPWSASTTFTEVARVGLLKVLGDHPGQEAMGLFRLERLQREIAGPDPSPLETLLAETITLCWLQLRHLEGEYAARMTLGQGRWSQEEDKRLERANRRFLRSVESLAKVRRLAGPALAVNIKALAFLAGIEESEA